MFSLFSSLSRSLVPCYPAFLSLSHFCFQFLGHEPFLSRLYALWLDLPRRRESRQRELKKLEEGILRSTMTTRFTVVRRRTTLLEKTVGYRTRARYSQDRMHQLQKR